ncbi:MgtC/SapB family protein [Candidatus Parcubacteria bacterium]|nr:MgtC/SapB family protein [Candidatus Parcubacteria bacterium]
MQEMLIKLILATFFGGLIGLERELKKKGAGLQTYSLVCLGACLFSIIAFSLYYAKIIDPSIIIMAIAVGMGFIGGGAIFRSETHIFGLTTAAGLWITAAIGLAIGAGFYKLAFLSTFFVLLILVGFGWVEEKVLKK